MLLMSLSCNWETHVVPVAAGCRELHGGSLPCQHVELNIIDMRKHPSAVHYGSFCRSEGTYSGPRNHTFFFLVQTKTVFGGQGRGAGGVFRLVSRGDLLRPQEPHFFFSCAD